MAKTNDRDLFQFPIDTGDFPGIRFAKSDNGFHIVFFQQTVQMLKGDYLETGMQIGVDEGQTSESVRQQEQMGIAVTA